LSFTPNQTTYSVKGTSDIGRRIAGAKVAVAAHKVYSYFGDKTGQDIADVKQFSGNPELVVFGQTYVSHQPAVNADNLATIEKLANQKAISIDTLLTPQAGLSDLQTIIYTFVNQQSRAKALDKLDPKDFFDWLATSKVSSAKQQKIANLNVQNAGAMDAMFTLVRELMKAKDEIIRELDQAEGDVTATTGGKPGGEGYVSGKDSVKLVPRDRWTPFRSD
jgi:hypothetical protein